MLSPSSALLALSLVRITSALFGALLVYTFKYESAGDIRSKFKDGKAFTQYPTGALAKSTNRINHLSSEAISVYIP